MLYLPTWDNIILWIIVHGKRKYLIVGHYADTLTLDFVQYELTALGKGLRGVGIADSEKIVALCTAIEIIADSLDKILR